MTVGNYVRLLPGWLSPSLSGCCGQALPPPTGTAARHSGPFGALQTGGAWCAAWLGASTRCPARPTTTHRHHSQARPHPVGLASLIAGSTTNFACNSPLTISNIEFMSLELQRFQTLLNLHRIELHAELMETGPTTAASFESGIPRRCSRF